MEWFEMVRLGCFVAFYESIAFARGVQWDVAGWPAGWDLPAI